VFFCSSDDYSSTGHVSSIVSIELLSIHQLRNTFCLLWKTLESRRHERLDFMADESNCFICFQKAQLTLISKSLGKTFVSATCQYDSKQLVWLIILPVYRLKETFHSTINSVLIYSSLGCFQICLTFFLMQTTKGKILKNVNE